MKKMKKIKAIFKLMLYITLALFTYVGCSTNETFTYSHGIDENGFWKDITALDYVELCEYMGISIPRDIHEISDESVQTEVNKILADFTHEKQVKDRAVVDGDTVNIDYVGSVDGVNFDGGSTHGLGTEVTIGVTNYIDGFFEQLIQRSPGESFDIEVTFPEDYGNEEINGKDAVFKVTLNYIVEMTTPELTDDFVAENLSLYYGFDTAAEMETYVKNSLQSSAILFYVQEYIFENTAITSLPKSLLEYQENSLIYYYQDYADYNDMDFEEFLITYMGVSTTEELLKEYLDNNTETAKFNLIMQAIAEDASISVNDDDVVAHFTEFVGAQDYSELEEYYGMPYLKLMVLHQSVLDYLEDNIVMD
ncbi:trigger factor [Candidatus Contubernalis alkaliaceticus]|uniref:trigger factor n=1 Tax=Candidatus Contubernalis alkaliaceticus TaxID=338645 RepID=UPI001F4C031A|nr:FKBP-type peptidyl-prolyl cis-trans isomerase [Candidatus Contubernalis alkalaceticus]UNC92218.1 FKBP-type peptidyl-prolyl cis-trans isomerase [Candidatus Contubernalis alkalaceticus]